MRERVSIGVCQYNKRRDILVQPDTPYVLDNTRNYYLFDVIPMGAPRMTQSDKWKVNPNHEDVNKRQRKEVTNYFAYKDSLREQAQIMGFTIGHTLDILFLIPMPDSWSGKKKQQSNKMPCTVKPDSDNLVKGVMDTFCTNDSHIWKIQVEKRWAYKGSIIIFE